MDVVSTRILGGLEDCRSLSSSAMSLVLAPCSPRTTTWGRERMARISACCPVGTSPITCIAGSPLRESRIADRASGRSSMMRTRICLEAGSRAAREGTKACSLVTVGSNGACTLDPRCPQAGRAGRRVGSKSGSWRNTRAELEWAPRIYVAGRDAVVFNYTSRSRRRQSGNTPNLAAEGPQMGEEFPEAPREETLGLGRHQPHADCVSHKAGDVVDIQPFHQRGAVRLNGFRADAEDAGDGPGRVTLGNELEDLPLSRRQLLER